MKNILHDFIEKLRSNRRYMLAAIVVAAVILIALILLIGSCRGESTDCRYPFRYRTSRGSTTITITGPFENGCSWTPVNRSDATVAVSEKKQDESKAVFTITALSEGLSHVDFLLVGAESAADVRFTISFDFFAVSDRRLEVSSAEYYENGGFTTVASGTDVPYSYSYDSDSRLHVIIASNEGDDWELVSDSDVGLSVYRASSEPSEAEFIFYGNPSGGIYYVSFINLTDSSVFELPIMVSNGTMFALTLDSVSSLYEMVSDGDISSLFGFSGTDPSELIPDQSEFAAEGEYVVDYSKDAGAEQDELPDYLDPEYFTAGEDYVEPEENYAESEF